MLNLKEIEILSSEQTQNRKKCKKCGHSRLLGRKEYIVCNYCGNYIFKDNATEFKYRMRENMIKEKRDMN